MAPEALTDFGLSAFRHRSVNPGRSGLLAVLGVAIAFILTTPAQAADISIKELVELVRTGLQQHTPDKSLAKSIHKLTLGEKMNLRVVEELESEGAGPESVAALDALLDASQKKPEPTTLPPFQSPARPTVEEQKQFFHLLNVNAMHYTASLPDFICTQIVRRYQLTPALPPGADRRRGQPPSPIGAGFWIPTDVLTVKLSYLDNHENYQLILVNGKKTKGTYETSGGAISEGDFGSTLLEIFSPESGTKFQWDHWTHLRKRLTRVYAFRTDRDRSHYKIGYAQPSGERKTVIAGRRGFIYADDTTQMVMRIVGHATEIPLGFPVTGQATILDYDYATISDKQFLLPLRADERLFSPRLQFKNVVEFHDYRKFTGESSISFDMPDPDAGKKASPDAPKPDDPKPDAPKPDAPK